MLDGKDVELNEMQKLLQQAEEAQIILAGDVTKSDMRIEDLLKEKMMIEGILEDAMSNFEKEAIRVSSLRRYVVALRLPDQGD